MKAWLLSLCTLALVLAFGLAATAAGDHASDTATPTPSATPIAGAAFSIAPASSYVGLGETFEVSIVVTSGPQAVDGAQFFLAFNPAYLVVVDAGGNPTTSITVGPAFDPPMVNQADNAAGLIFYAAGALFAHQPLLGTGVLASVRFKATAAPAVVSLTFTSEGRRTTKLTSAGADVPVALNNGSAIITAPVTATPTPQGYTVSGIVAEFPPCQGAMRGVTVYLDGRSTQTDVAAGRFTFHNVPDGSYAVHVAGCNPYGCWTDSPVTVAGADVTNVRVCMDALATATPTATAPPTVTPTATPTSIPEPPQLLTPANHAVLPQPVAPDSWYFSWSTRPTCSRTLHVVLPDRALTEFFGGAGNSFTYQTTAYIQPGEGSWWVEIVCGQGSARSDTWTFTILPPPPTPTPTPSVTPTYPCPTGTPEPLWVDPVTSPTDALTQTVIVNIGNGEVVTVTAESGVFAVTGSFSSWGNPARVEIALLPGTTHHLLVTARVRQATWNGCILGGYTLSTTSDRHGNPLVIVQQATAGSRWRLFLPVIVLN